VTLQRQPVEPALHRKSGRHLRGEGKTRGGGGPAVEDFKRGAPEKGRPLATKRKSPTGDAKHGEREESANEESMIAVLRLGEIRGRIRPDFCFVGYRMATNSSETGFSNGKKACRRADLPVTGRQKLIEQRPLNTGSRTQGVGP